MSLCHYCHTCSISNLHCSNIIPHCFGSTHLIPSEFQLTQLKFTLILFSQTFASYSIFNYIWNTSKLLLLSGDVEINPGPRPIDQNPVFCTIGSRKINLGPQQDMAPTCSKQELQRTMSSSLSRPINRPNSSWERFRSLYHLEMPATWLWNRRSYHTTYPSLWTTKSTLCCWKILLHLHESYPYLLCWSILSLRQSILR